MDHNTLTKERLSPAELVSCSGGEMKFPKHRAVMYNVAYGLGYIAGLGILVFRYCYPEILK